MIMTNGFNAKQTAIWLLRLALVFSLVYAAIAGFMTPANWIGFLPQFVSEIMSAELALKVWSSGELFLAVWIMSAWRTSLPVGITALGLFLMVAFNWGQISILFRDI